MKRLKSCMLILFLFTFSMWACIAKANSLDAVRSYRYSLYNLTVEIKNPKEAYPNQTIIVNFTARASANLTIEYAAVELYTFNNSTMEEENFHTILCIGNRMDLSINQPFNETYNVTIPSHALNVVYGKLILTWTEYGTDEANTYTREPNFIMMCLRNRELEMLRNKIPELERENEELKGNLTEIENRYSGELSGMRSVATILAITTVFFVATTLYLVFRKPKEYW